jgi:hypothetical protein
VLVAGLGLSSELQRLAAAHAPIGGTCIEDFLQTFAAGGSSSATLFKLARINGIASFEAWRHTGAPVLFSYASSMRSYFRLQRSSAARAAAAEGAQQQQREEEEEEGAEEDAEGSAARAAHRKLMAGRQRTLLRAQAKHAVRDFVLLQHPELPELEQACAEAAAAAAAELCGSGGSGSSSSSSSSSRGSRGSRGKSRASASSSSSSSSSFSPMLQQPLLSSLRGGSSDRADAALAAMFALAQEVEHQALVAQQSSAFWQLVEAKLPSARLGKSAGMGAGKKSRSKAAEAQDWSSSSSSSSSSSDLCRIRDALSLLHSEALQAEVLRRAVPGQQAQLAAGSSSASSVRKGSKQAEVALARVLAPLEVQPSAVQRLYGRLRGSFSDSVRETLMGDQEALLPWRLGPS